MHLLQRWSFFPKRLIGLVVPFTMLCVITSGFIALFVLYHPRGPGRIQRIGWQSWDVINGDNTRPSSSGAAINVTEGKEWWEADVLNAGEAPASVSLPLDVWAPMLPHTTGLSEIAVVSCYMPPMLGGCAPKTTAEEDALKGKWVRVTPDLNQKTGLWYLNIYYRRTRRLDVPLIIDLMILPEGDLPPGSHTQWVKAEGSLVDGVYPSAKTKYLWYMTQKPLAAIPESLEIDSLVTEIDVQYGDANRTLWGFQKTNAPVTERKKDKTDAVWVTFRKGMKPPPHPNRLHFSQNGTFKIMQVADLHYSVSRGSCRDVNASFLPPFLSSLASGEDCHGDTVTQSWLADTLEIEKPDLVVFTGDQLNGQMTSWSATSVIAKAIDEVVKAGILWTVVFGNHDAESTDLSREEQMRVYKSFPGHIEEMQSGEEWVDGVGNYLAKVRSADPSATHLLTLYFLDSHAYSGSGWTFWKPAEYDWLKPTQIEWFQDKSQSISSIERPFTPDGAKDIGTIWRRQGAAKYLSKPNALVFFHIPLPEAYNEADISAKGEVLSHGEMLENAGSPKKNSGFFDNAILKATTQKADGSSTNEVKVIANGHCHLTDRCRRVKGVWHCFGGGGSFSGYGKIGFERRFRIYEISDYGETIWTYKRTPRGEIVDDMVLIARDAKGA